MEQAKKRDSQQEARDLRKQFGERIRSVRGTISREEFGQIVGVHRNTVVRYEQGAAQPTVDTIQKICSEFGISCDWLVNGQGTKEYVDGEIEFTFDQEMAVRSGALLTVKPMYERADLVAPWLVTPDWIAKADVKGQLFVFSMADDGMAPTIDKGAPVLVDMSRSLYVRPKKSGLYLLRSEGLVTIRRIECLPGDRYKLSADNPRYGSEEYSEYQKMSCAGRVLAWKTFL